MFYQYLKYLVKLSSYHRLAQLHQRVVVVFVAGRQFAIRALPVTDGGYEVEPGMVCLLYTSIRLPTFRLERTLFFHLYHRV